MPQIDPIYKQFSTHKFIIHSELNAGKKKTRKARLLASGTEVRLVYQSPRQQLGYLADESQAWRLANLRAATQETERGELELSQSVTLYWHWPDQ